jgi:hypothetical protein
MRQKRRKKMFDENADPRVCGIPFILDSLPNTPEMEYTTCPFCGGYFAVDSSYLDQVSDVIHCPMCCMEVIIEEEG